PHPYPAIVRDFQAVIGRETRSQILEVENRLPDTVIACVGGGSNSLGIFSAFLDDRHVSMFGIEAGGSDEGHAAALGTGTPGVMHGAYSYLMQDADGQVMPAHSIAPGLDYPGVGPEHSALKDSGRVTYESVTDEEAIAAFQVVCRTEGIIPALEPSHAVAYAIRAFGVGGHDGKIVVINLSGRGDKDVACVQERIAR
ncbi:MAG: pyridoxal-phosphate dependent enzyme, partial [Candidatus Krumholzibacteriota bacterium]|nr:pyridoxal-phosphate dependent enzyme [Candidatus Krumholzibacteriota bacterium]